MEPDRPVPFELGVAAPDELGAVARFCQECFGPDAAPGYFLARLPVDPALLPDGALVARTNGRLVAHVSVLGLALRFGAAIVPCGGIANVCTAPAYRRRGASGALLGRALALMRNAGFPLSALSTGIPGHYARWGWVAWPRFERRFFELLPPAPPPSNLPGARPLDPVRDRAELVRLHALAGAHTPGVLERTPAFWERHWDWTPRHPGERPELALAVEDPGTRRLLAYVRGALDPARRWSAVLEFGAEPGAAGAVEALAQAFVSAARALGARALTVPEAAGPLVEAVRPWARAATRETDDTLMLNVLDLAGFLAALAPELAARAAAARAGDGTVLVGFGDQRTVLRVAGGAVSTRPPVPGDENLPGARLDPARWIEVFMGTRLFSAQPFAAASRLGERELNLLDALFPPRQENFWHADSF